MYIKDLILNAHNERFYSSFLNIFSFDNDVVHLHDYQFHTAVFLFS